MLTPTRILRADADDIERDPPGPTSREQQRYERILAVAETVMARHGTHTITLGGLTLALRLSSGALKRYFPDMQALLGTLLLRHLGNIARAVGEVPHDVPDRPQGMRAAYLAYTRTEPGEFTDAHLLLVRDRHLLPKDLLQNIEATHRDLGDILAPGYGALALDLLDALSFNARSIELALANVAAIDAKERANPVPPASPGDSLSTLPSIQEGTSTPHDPLERDAMRLNQQCGASRSSSLF